MQKYESAMDKIIRMLSVTSTIENGFAPPRDKAAWLGEYLHELTSFPLGKHDGQADASSQALDWFKQESRTRTYGLLIRSVVLLGEGDLCTSIIFLFSLGFSSGQFCRRA